MGDMKNLVMVMPDEATYKEGRGRRFPDHAIWDPAEAERLFGAQAAHYLRDVEALADGSGWWIVTDHAAYADAIRAAVRENRRRPRLACR